MSRIRPNAAASRTYFVPKDCATIVSTTLLQNDRPTKGFRHQRYKRYAIGCAGSADGAYGSNDKPARRSSLGMIARVKGADESEVFSSARGRNAASLTSSRSGRGPPPTYVMAKMRNVSFAASVTRFRTARIGPARPAMPVSSFTSRSMVWTTDSRGSTYPDGIVQRPFDGPYVLRTTSSFPSRTRKAPAPTVIGSAATLRAMVPVRSPNEMALSQVSFLGRLGAPWHGTSRSPRGAS